MMKLRFSRVNRGFYLIAVVLMAMVLVAACGGEEEVDPVTVTVRMGEVNGTFYFAAADAEEVGTGDVVIEAPGDAPIIFELVNEGAIEHTFTVSALNIDIAVSAGSTVTTDPFEINAGSYEVHCAVPGHRAAGQVATLVVGGS